MCEVSWSAQFSARLEMMKLGTTSDLGSTSWVPYGVPKWIKAPLCQKIIRHAPACTHVRRFTVPEKRVRRYRVRTDVCSAMKMNAQSANALEGQAPRARSRLVSSSLKSASSEASLPTHFPPPFTGVLLLALERAWGSTRKEFTEGESRKAECAGQAHASNLASEFTSQTGHTGIMDTTFCVRVGPALHTGRRAWRADLRDARIGRHASLAEASGQRQVARLSHVSTQLSTLNWAPC
jgi:hypothetical protein